MDNSRKARIRGSIRADGLGLFMLACVAVLIFFMVVFVIPTLRDEHEIKVVKGWRQEAPHSENDDCGEELPRRRLPQAIIIGSRKSGTRALLKFLSANPNIVPASKEVHFFDRMHNYRLGLDWYREQMPLSLAGEITIEKSPAYFVTKGVPERIKAMSSKVKLIVVVRNPVTRLISDFSQLLAHKTHRELGANRDYDDYYHFVVSGEASGSGENSKKQWTTNNISEQIWSQAETSFERYVRRPDGGINEQRRAIKASMYSDYLERWLNQFERDQLHVVDGEKLISSPTIELRKVESFLGLDPIIKESDFVFNQTKGFYCLSPRNSTWAPTKLVRRKREAQQFARSTCLGDDKGRRHVKVKMNLVDELQQFYAPFNQYLYSLVGRDFEWSQVGIK